MIDKDDKFIYALLVFAVVYIGSHLIVAYIGGKLS